MSAKILYFVLILLSLNPLDALPIQVDPRGICTVEGVEYSAVGFGTASLRGNSFYLASQCGYQIIDTASAYGTLAHVGALCNQLGRHNFYIISKFWRNLFTYNDLRADLLHQLDQLQTHYLDAYLMHWPDAHLPIGSILRALDQLRSEKLIRHIGLSNININHLKKALTLNIPIEWIQLEMSPYYYDPELLAFCKEHGVTVQAWGPLGSGKIKTPDILLEKIALKHQKTPAQIAIKWILQHGCIPLCISEKPHHIQQNIDVGDFLLTEEEMEQIDARARKGKRGRLTWEVGLGFTDEFDFTYEQCWPSG